PSLIQHPAATEIYTLSLHDALPILSMFNTGRVRRNGFLDSDLETIHERLVKASEARQREILTGEVTYIGTAIPTDEEIEKIPTEDRKSTRLNSSHVKISYAVFCLKK